MTEIVKTPPRDDIAGLIERLRISLAGVAQDETSGDNLTILLASYFEPGIENEELDDSGTWKQGALDAADSVLDAIHAHYATQLDALRARVKELDGQLRTVQNAAKTIADCHNTELEHLRQNKAFDHKLRAEHESLIERDAMMTEALEAAESTGDSQTQDSEL